MSTITPKFLSKHFLVHIFEEEVIFQISEGKALTLFNLLCFSFFIMFLLQSAYVCKRRLVLFCQKMWNFGQLFQPAHIVQFNSLYKILHALNEEIRWMRGKKTKLRETNCGSVCCKLLTCAFYALKKYLWDLKDYSNQKECLQLWTISLFWKLWPENNHCWK